MIVAFSVLQAAVLPGSTLFNATVGLKVYERGLPGSGDRLLGFTPARNNAGVRVPKHTGWFVRPTGSYSEKDWKAFSVAATRYGIPGLDLSERWDVTDETLSWISPSGSLRYLRLDKTRVSDQGLHMLSHFKELQSLTVSPKTSDAGLRALESLRSLRELDLRGSRVSEAAWEDLSHLSHLESLTLNKQFSDHGIEGLAALKTIRELDLSETTIGDAGTESLLGLTRLESIYFSPRVGDQTLRQISGLKNLKRLDLSNSRITDAGLQDFGDFPKLEQLALSNTALTDASMPAIARLKNLRVLELSGTQVTTAGLEFLAKLPKLDTLSLGWTQLTNADLSALARCASIKTVILDNTLIPETLMIQIVELRRQANAGILANPPPVKKSLIATPRASKTPVVPVVQSAVPSALISKTAPEKRFSGLRRIQDIETQRSELQDVFIPSAVNPDARSEMDAEQSLGEINVRAGRSSR